MRIILIMDLFGPKILRKIQSNLNWKWLWSSQVAHCASIAGLSRVETDRFLVLVNGLLWRPARYQEDDHEEASSMGLVITKNLVTEGSNISSIDDTKPDLADLLIVVWG